MTKEKMQEVINKFCESRDVCHATEAEPVPCPLKDVATVACPNNLTDEQLEYGTKEILKITDKEMNDALDKASDELNLTFKPINVNMYIRDYTLRYMDSIFGSEAVASYLTILSFFVALDGDCFIAERILEYREKLYGRS